MFGVKSIPNSDIPIIIPSAIMAGLVALCLTLAADFVLRLAYGFRRPLPDEEEKLHTLYAGSHSVSGELLFGRCH